MTQEECDALIDDIFKKADSDFNGFIDEDEFTRMYINVKEKLLAKQIETMKYLTE